MLQSLWFICRMGFWEFADEAKAKAFAAKGSIKIEGSQYAVKMSKGTLKSKDGQGDQGDRGRGPHGGRSVGK